MIGLWQSTGVSVDSQFNYEYEETPTEIYLTDWKAFAPPNWSGNCRGENCDDSEYYCLLSTSSSRFAVIHIEKCPASRATKSSPLTKGLSSRKKNRTCTYARARNSRRLDIHRRIDLADDSPHIDRRIRALSEHNGVDRPLTQLS